MISSLAPASFDNKEIGIPSSNRNFTQRSLNSNPYRFPYRLSFPLFFFLTSSTSSMGSLLSPSEECHPFTLSYLAHDLVVSPPVIVTSRVHLSMTNCTWSRYLLLPET